MPHRPFVIRVEGPDARSAASDISDWIAREFGLRSIPAPVVGEDGADAYVVALRGGLLSTDDLTARANLKDRLDRLIDLARAHRAGEPAARIVLNAPDGESLPLDRTSAEAILRVVPQ
jgi:hypothetical protein